VQCPENATIQQNRAAILSHKEGLIGEDVSMQAIQGSYRGLGLLLDLNWDRAFFVIAIATALSAGAFVASF
jgi:hypothetical protein